MGDPELQAPYLLGLVATLSAGASFAFLSSYAAQRFQLVALSFACSVAALALCWYTSSVSFVILNRFVMAGRKLSFPATLSLMHMAIKGAIAGVAVAREYGGEIQGYRRRRGMGVLTGSRHWICERYGLSRGVLLTFVVPLGVATAADIFLSNLALRYISMTLYTVAKSTALVFTFLFSILLRLQRPSVMLTASVLGVCVGVVLCSVRPTPIHAGGLVAVLVAAALSASRWVVSQKYLQRVGVQPSVMILILLQAPVTIGFMSPLALAEAPDLAAASAMHSSADVGAFAAMGLLGGVLAFVLLVVELQLINMTSALTTNVIGHLKDIVAVLAAVMVLGEEISLLNLSGVLLTVASAVAYSWFMGRGTHVAVVHWPVPVSAAEDVVDSSSAGHVSSLPPSMVLSGPGLGVGVQEAGTPSRPVHHLSLTDTPVLDFSPDFAGTTMAAGRGRSGGAAACARPLGGKLVSGPGRPTATARHAASISRSALDLDDLSDSDEGLDGGNGRGVGVGEELTDSSAQEDERLSEHTRLTAGLPRAVDGAALRSRHHTVVDADAASSNGGSAGGTASRLQRYTAYFDEGDEERAGAGFVSEAHIRAPSHGAAAPNSDSPSGEQPLALRADTRADGSRDTAGGAGEIDSAATPRASASLLRLTPASRAARGSVVRKSAPTASAKSGALPLPLAGTAS
jgi:solute carrier family 35 protein C2